MTYQEALNKINSLLRFGMKPGLERVAKLLELLGNPQNRLKFVHVAGTNGKGSACALLSSVLTKAGCKTGLYISPYIIDFRERMQINGQMISQQQLTDLVEKTFPLVEQMAADGEEITEFEFITALAIQWYAQNHCDVVVLEVGLGGRFDATNVIAAPLVSVIMSISLDHTAILGDTVEQIAFEKCGIIKQGGTTVCFPIQPEAALSVIKQIAAERENSFLIADLNMVTPISTGLHGTELRYKNSTLHLPFIGDHQIQNAVTVLTVIEVLRQKGIVISEQAIIGGFHSANFPARLEVLCEKPAFLLDGAHNPSGAAALADAIKKYLPGKNVVAVMGMLADKDTHTAIDALAGLFSHVITLAPSNPRALSAADLAMQWQGHCPNVLALDDMDEAICKAFELATPNGAVVVCGSLYLASDVRPHILTYLKQNHLLSK